MDFLISYTQEKTDKKGDNVSNCELVLLLEGNNIIYKSNFDSDYKRYGEKKHIRFEHQLTINTSTGDIEVLYKLLNNGLTPEIIFRDTDKKTKNNFKSLENLCDSRFNRGEKRINYWGSKYRQITDKIFKKFYTLLRPHFKSEYLKNKTYDVFEISPLYDLVLDFHLEKKGIKGHDNIYFDIQNEYPKKKWLLKNDNKFLPSVLDSYGIKSKYLIGELSKKRDSKLNISAINYFCKLFGENYVEYFKSGSWKKHCVDTPPNKKTHTLLNDSEKKFALNLLMKHNENRSLSESILYTFNKLFTIREQLTQLGYDLKFNPRNEFELDNLMETWTGYKNYVTRGYKWKYDIDDDFKKMIECDITIDGEVFKPKMILTEEEFKLEGLIMKNCMSKQFSNGAIYIFISLQYKRKRINLQYRKGNLIQSYGKANTQVPDIFDEAVEVLTKRFESKKDIVWVKQKYDIINK